MISTHREWYTTESLHGTNSSLHGTNESLHGKSIITNCRNLYIFISFLKGEILEDALLFSNLVPGIDLVGGLLSFPALGVDSSASQLGPVFLCSWYGGGLRWAEMLEIGVERNAATQLNVIFEKVTVKAFCLLIILCGFMVPFPP